MSLLKIIHYPDPVLLSVGRPVSDEEFGRELSLLVENMFETMHEARGVGLAAPQIGVSKRLFVMDVPSTDGKSQKQVFVNPEVVHVEGNQTGEEGCLSFPGIFQSVQREMRVVVRAQDINGASFEEDLSQLAARCVLHETDHCDGIVFIDRMTPLKRELAKRKIRKLQRTGEWV